MKSQFALLSPVIVLAVVTIVQWVENGHLKNDNQVLVLKSQGFSHSAAEAPPQPKSEPTDPSSEVLKLRSDVHSLRQQLHDQTSASRRPLSAPELAQALAGNGALPPRTAPLLNSLPSGPQTYRFEMRYTGLTTALQQRNADGTFTDLLEGPFDTIAWAENHLFIRSMATPDNIVPSWTILDLQTGQVQRERDGTRITDEIEDDPEFKRAKLIRRNGNIDEWRALFR